MRILPKKTSRLFFFWLGCIATIIAYNVSPFAGMIFALLACLVDIYTEPK